MLRPSSSWIARCLFAGGVLGMLLATDPVWAWWGIGSGGASPRRETRRSVASIQKGLIRKIDGLYREIAAASKAKCFDYAQDKIQVMEELLDPKLLPGRYCQKMKLKLDIVKDRMRQYYAQEQRRENRDREEKMVQQMMISTMPSFDDVPPEDEDSGAEDVARGRPDEEIPATEASRPSVPGPALTLKGREDRVAAVAPSEAKRSVPGGERPERLTRAAKSRPSPVEPRQKLIDKVESLYKEGVELFRRGVYTQAYQKLSAVSRLWPNYKLSQEYLQLIGKQTAEIPAPAASPIPDSLSRKELIDGYLDAMEQKDGGAGSP